MADTSLTSSYFPTSIHPVTVEVLGNNDLDAILRLPHSAVEAAAEMKHLMLRLHDDEGIEAPATFIYSLCVVPRS